MRLNHHAFFVIFDRPAHQVEFLERMRERGVHPYIGYLPLHSSSYGRKLGYAPEDVPVTEEIASRIVRLPFYAELAGDVLSYNLDCMRGVLDEIYGS